MSAFLGSVGMPEVVAGIMVLALNAYVLMGGADFGGGVWDLLASGPRRDAQRALIANSIAPIWEANHVWLIVVVVVLFTAFPSAYAIIGTVLHIPVSLLLIGIVLRGSAFVFRSYGSREASRRERWGLAFAISSAVTPVLLGVIIGALVSGAVGEASDRVGTASFMSVFIAPWAGVFPLAVGVFALALFAYLAAVYLALAASEQELREDFRRRALVMAVVVFVVAAVALVLSFSRAPLVAHGLMGGAWSLVLHVCTGVSAVVAIVALVRRRFALARLGAAAQVSFILWGWAFAQFPFVIPTTLSIRDGAAPRVTLELLLVGLGVGALVLIPSLLYLFRTFGSERREATGVS